MKISIKIFLLLVIIFSVSACTKKKLTPNTDGPDILMARDCGLDKLQCCTDTPVCSYAQQCCIDPNNKERNYCSNECGCGGEGEFCCEGNKCNNGSTCFDGICAVCGGKDQPCCEGTKCEGALACSDEKCVECGVAGNPCCADDKCVNQTKLDKSRTNCSGGMCQPCGSSGQLACVGELNCLKGNLLSNSSCFQCGGDNQPCCNPSSGLSYDCDPNLKLKCNLGFCSPVK